MPNEPLKEELLKALDRLIASVFLRGRERKLVTACRDVLDDGGIDMERLRKRLNQKRRSK